MKRSLESSELKSCSYSSILDNQVQGDQSKPIGVEPEVEAVAKEVNSSRTKVLVPEATRVDGRIMLSVSIVARRTTLLRTALTRRMTMIVTQADQERLHQPGGLRRKKEKVTMTSNSSNSNSRAEDPGSILHQWVDESMLQPARKPKFLGG